MTSTLRSTAPPPLSHRRARLLAFLVAAVIGAVLGVVSPVAGPAGAVPTYGGYVPLDAPRRILDTRTTSPVVAGADRSVTVPVGNGIPQRSQIGALVLNVTVVSPSQATHVTVWGAGTKPSTSTLNVVAGETRANSATVAPGSGPANASLLTIANNAGSAHVLIDVVGYYQPTPADSAARFHPTTPFRLADSRKALGFTEALHAGETRVLTVSKAGSVVPTTATAVVVNVTAVGPTQATDLRLHGAGVPVPNASTVNAPAGAVVPNLAIVRLTTNLAGQGRIAVTNSAGDVHVLVDVVGWFEPGTIAGGYWFFPQAPQRLRDSRTTTILPPTGTAAISAGGTSAAVLLVNLTGIATTAATHLTIYPSVGKIPPTSNLNLVAGQTSANAAFVGLNSGYYKITNAAGYTHYIVDSTGYFATSPT